MQPAAGKHGAGTAGGDCQPAGRGVAAGSRRATGVCAGPGGAGGSAAFVRETGATRGTEDGTPVGDGEKRGRGSGTGAGGVSAAGVVVGRYCPA